MKYAAIIGLLALLSSSAYAADYSAIDELNARVQADLDRNQAQMNQIFGGNYTERYGNPYGQSYVERYGNPYGVNPHSSQTSTDR
jgi:hypothetical protein